MANMTCRPCLKSSSPRSERLNAHSLDRYRVGQCAYRCSLLYGFVIIMAHDAFLHNYRDWRDRPKIRLAFLLDQLLVVVLARFELLDALLVEVVFGDVGL